MKKDIFIILPYKESLNPNHAGAVSLYVKDTTKHSKYKKRIQVISSEDFNNKSELFRNRNHSDTSNNSTWFICLPNTLKLSSETKSKLIFPEANLGPKVIPSIFVTLFSAN